jgi:DNA-3-methyladenine glycosylase I
MTTPDLPRCGWATSDPLYIAYHDEEWGRPVRDDRHLFEMLTLEGAQAGLSWITILKRREGYRRAFEGFDAERIARFGEKDVERLMADPGIIRNRAKIAATLANAKVLNGWPEGELDELLWPYAPEADARPARRTLSDVPAVTDESTAMAKELKKRGLRFVGPTTAYALMQACGLVDDHLTDCFVRGASAP